MSCSPVAYEQCGTVKDQAAGEVAAKCKGDCVEKPSEMDVGSPEKSVGKSCWDVLGSLQGNLGN